MTDSILDSVKEALGVPVDSTGFDQELMLHINSVFATLSQFGVGPIDGFMITNNEAVWGDFLGTNLRMNEAKNYMFLRVKLLFDPPSTSHVLAAMQEQIKESGWRLNAVRESTEWTDPLPDPEPDPFADAPI